MVIDAEGLGSALWGVLGRPEDTAHWTLYAGRGLERQALVDELLVAVEEQDAMNKALLLALVPPPVFIEPMIAWR